MIIKSHYYKCPNCGFRTEEDIRCCSKCKGRMTKYETVRHIPDPEPRVYDNSCLPELAELLDIDHSELLEWNNNDPDGLDKRIKEVIK
jgi:hypothetical protein